MKRGLLLHFWADIDSNPTMMGLIRGLTVNGLELDVCYETRDFLLPPNFPAGVTPLEVPSWKSCSSTLLDFVQDRLKTKDYSFVIAVDLQGLLVAEAVLAKHDIPLIYLSFELTFEDELETAEDRILKQREREISRQAALIIIQDEERGTLLTAENNLAPDKIVFLPNSPAASPDMSDSDYLRRHLQISSGRKIVLHAGSFASWTYGEELCESAHGWDDRFVLVVHTRQFPQHDCLITKMLKQCDPHKVIFSTTPLPFDSYGKLISSCDIGLVLYKTAPTKYTQKNIFHIGLSSGKFAYFARYGKPVLTNDLPSYRTMFQRHANGACLKGINALQNVLPELEDSFQAMGNNNDAFFREHLDFNKFFPSVVEKIKDLAQ